MMAKLVGMGLVPGLAGSSASGPKTSVPILYGVLASGPRDAGSGKFPELMSGRDNQSATLFSRPGICLILKSKDWRRERQRHTIGDWLISIHTEYQNYRMFNRPHLWREGTIKQTTNYEITFHNLTPLGIKILPYCIKMSTRPTTLQPNPTKPTFFSSFTWGKTVPRKA